LKSSEQKLHTNTTWLNW